MKLDLPEPTSVDVEEACRLEIAVAFVGHLMN